MSLKATSSLIKIQNSSGVDMFSSDDKLLYKKYSFNGSLSLGSSSVQQVSASLPGASIDNKTLYIINGTITSANGNISSNFINSNIDLSTPVLLHFDSAPNGIYSGYQNKIISQSVLSTHIRRGSSANDLYLIATYAEHSGGDLFTVSASGGTTRQYYQTSYFYRVPSTYVNFSYTVTFYGWK